MRLADRLPIIAAAVLAATPAAAHEGHHEGMPAMALARHILTQPDHLLAVAGLAALITAAGWSLRGARARVRVRK